MQVSEIFHIPKSQRVKNGCWYLASPPPREVDHSEQRKEGTKKEGRFLWEVTILILTVPLPLVQTPLLTCESSKHPPPLRYLCKGWGERPPPPLWQPLLSTINRRVGPVWVGTLRPRGPRSAPAPHGWPHPRASLTKSRVTTCSWLWRKSREGTVFVVTHDD